MEAFVAGFFPDSPRIAAEEAEVRGWGRWRGYGTLAGEDREADEFGGTARVRGEQSFPPNPGKVTSLQVSVSVSVNRDNKRFWRIALLW